MTAMTVFGKPRYSYGETVDFQVLVDRPATVDVTFTGTVTEAGEPLTVTGTVQVDQVQYGQFTADGYDVVQDPTDPSR